MKQDTSGQAWISLPVCLVSPSYHDFLDGVHFGSQRLRLSGRSKVICSYRTSVRALAFDPEALTVPSGMCETHITPFSLVIHLTF